MLKLIQKEIDDYVENGYCVNPEGILSAMEEAGMLPPQSDKSCQCLSKEWDEE